MKILLLGLVTGIGFGYVLQRSGVSECACLYNALNLRNTKAIKLMATAVVTGLLILSPLQAVIGLDLGAKDLNLTALILGGVIFGFGFALSGLCPGTALAALGAGKKDVLYLIAGALTGSFAYALAYEPIKPLLIDSSNFGKVTIYSLLGTSPFITAYLLALIILAAVFLLNRKDQQAGVIDADATYFSGQSTPFP